MFGKRLPVLTGNCWHWVSCMAKLYSYGGCQIVVCMIITRDSLDPHGRGLGWNSKMHLFNNLIGDFDFSYAFKKHKTSGILKTLLKEHVMFVPIYIYLCLYHYYIMECAINFSLPILKDILQIHVQFSQIFLTISTSHYSFLLWLHNTYAIAILFYFCHFSSFQMTQHLLMHMIDIKHLTLNKSLFKLILEDYR